MPRTLHLAQSGVYGDEWASLTLPEAVKYFSLDHPSILSSSAPLDATAADRVRSATGHPSTPAACWEAHALPGAPKEIPASPALDFGNPGDDRDWRIIYQACTPLPASLEADAAQRGWTLDLRPALIASRGPLVDALVQSKTSEYLEFRTCGSARVLMQGPGEAGTAQVFQVPCSKADIFRDSTLTLTEKRTLMKFMLGVVDLASARDTTHAQRLNEARLARGRALLRPQNKPTSAAAVAATDQQSFPHALQAAGLSPRLVAVLMHAVALVNPAADHGGQAMSAAEGMQRLCLYVAAAGQFGTTSFILPSYGMGDVTQAFVRLSAVHGGISLLGITPGALLHPPHQASPPQPVAAGADAEAAPAAEAPVGDRAPPSPVPPPMAVLTSGGVVFKAGAVVCGTRYVPAWTVEGRLLQGQACPDTHASTLHCRAMGLIRLGEAGGTAAGEGEQTSVGRSYAVALPGIAGAPVTAAAHILALDTTAKVCPPGHAVVHVGVQVRVQLPGEDAEGAAQALREGGRSGCEAAQRVLEQAAPLLCGEDCELLWHAQWCAVVPWVIASAVPAGVVVAGEGRVVGSLPGAQAVHSPHGDGPGTDTLFFHGEYDAELAQQLFGALVAPGTPYFPQAQEAQQKAQKAEEARETAQVANPAQLAEQAPGEEVTATPPAVANSPQQPGPTQPSPGALDAAALAELDDLDF